MELRQVRYFLSVAKHRSFTRAAAELFVVQPALSQQIKRLEHELGVELIDRRGGQVALTLAGITFKRRAEVILSDVNIALSEMRGFSEATTGRVAFGAVYTLNGGAIDFPELFSGFSAKYPAVQLRFREGNTEELVGLLRNGELDLALLDLTFVSDPSDLTTELITDEELVALVGPTHRLARASVCRIEDLADERFIRLGSTSNPRGMKFFRLAEAAGFSPQFAFLAGSVDIARSLVSRGLGVDVTHAWAGEGPGPPVVPVKLEGGPLRCQVVMAQMKDTYRSPSVSAFIAFAWDALHFRNAAID
jgi:DNA-binding transcriptional LysR family regulator